MPDASARGGHTTDYESYEAETDGRNGGYRYGTRVQPKEFSIDIYYENLERKQLNKLLALFDRKAKGELIFEDRPYAKYTAVPNGRIELQEYRENRNGQDLYHGTMTIPMKCYDPFAKLDVSADLTAAAGEIYWPAASMRPAAPTASSKSFLVYNPGTEITPAIIRIAGSSGEEMIIRNKTTGQECMIRGMTAGMTGSAGKNLEINAETGRVELVGTGRELAFELHDGGYISMAPNRNFEEEYPVQYTSGSVTITMQNGADQDMVGKYIYLEGAWRRTTSYINATQMAISAAMAKSGTAKAPIVTMNEIEIEGGTLTKLELEFEPRVR